MRVGVHVFIQGVGIRDHTAESKCLNFTFSYLSRHLSQLSCDRNPGVVLGNLGRNLETGAFDTIGYSFWRKAAEEITGYQV